MVIFLNVTGSQRINRIVDYILARFNDKTHNIKWPKSFNSIFANNSIEEAIKYYDTFKAKLAAIFSNEDKNNEHLERIMKDYNKEFGTDYELSKYDGYKSQISKAVKDRKIDLLIVGDMFLTVFDQPYLNTLWLDKPTNKDHNLIQAFSSTKRIYNEIKSNAIIFSFNDIKKR